MADVSNFQSFSVRSGRRMFGKLVFYLDLGQVPCKPRSFNFLLKLFNNNLPFQLLAKHIVFCITLLHNF
jgi:hypothetical protein